MGRISGGATTTSCVLTRLALGVLSALALALALVLIGSARSDADDLSGASDPAAPERPAVKRDGLVGGVVSTARSTVRSTVDRPVGTPRSERGSATPTKQRTAKPAKVTKRTEMAAPRADRTQRRVERPAAAKPQTRSAKAAAEKAAPRADRKEPAPNAPRSAPGSAPTVHDTVRSTVATTAGAVDRVGRTVTTTADAAIADLDRDVDRVVTGVPVVRDLLPRQVLGSTTAPATATVDDVVATTTTLLGRTGDQVADVVPDPATDLTDRLPAVPRRDVAAAPPAHAPTAPAVMGTAERTAPATAPSAPVISGLHDRDVRSAGPASGSGSGSGSEAADLSASEVDRDDATAAAQFVTGSTGSTAVGAGTSGGSAGGTGSAPAAAGAAYLSQLLVGLPGLTGSPVGSVDWVLPSSVTADLGSSPD